MTDQPGAEGVVISMKEVYDIVVGMDRTLSKFVSVTEVNQAATDARLDSHSTHLSKHDGEIATLQSDVAQLKNSHARRAPWWQWVATLGIVVTAAFLLLDRFAPLAQH